MHLYVLKQFQAYIFTIFIVIYVFINEQILIVENMGHLTSREGSARDMGQNASNTEHPVLYGIRANPITK